MQLLSFEFDLQLLRSRKRCGAKEKDNKFVRESISSFVCYQQTCGSGFYYFSVLRSHRHKNWSHLVLVVQVIDFIGLKLVLLWSKFISITQILTYFRLKFSITHLVQDQRLVSWLIFGLVVIPVNLVSFSILTIRAFRSYGSIDFFILYRWRNYSFNSVCSLYVGWSWFQRSNSSMGNKMVW